MSDDLDGLDERERAGLDRLYGACGRILWLWSNSGLHKSWPVALQTRFVLPAVMTGQYEILEEGGVPRAYCSWAWLTLEAETRLVIDPNSLRPEDWRAGNRLWFIDWIGPFAASDTRRLRGRMAERFPRELARALRVKPTKTEARIATFAGSKLTREEAMELRSTRYRELTDSLASHPGRGEGFRLRQAGARSAWSPD